MAPLMSWDFNPLLPHGRRLPALAILRRIYAISTHSSRTGGDDSLQQSCKRVNNFNPLLPHGRRPLGQLSSMQAQLFQPTPPAREETKVRMLATYDLTISTHSSRTGGDICLATCRRFFSSFQPTPPAREETPPRPRRMPVPQHFNPLLPHGRRHRLDQRIDGTVEFQPTPPAREET